MNIASRIAFSCARDGSGICEGSIYQAERVRNPLGFFDFKRIERKFIKRKFIECRFIKLRKLIKLVKLIKLIKLRIRKETHHEKINS